MLKNWIALLSFQLDQAGFDSWRWRELVWALVLTWIVGIGRWWDDSKASLLQKTGLGSVAYILLLSTLLWLLAWPLVKNRKSWRFFHVLSFVGLTAPPALLYAIPVERFMSMSLATHVNLWFLAIVALWRVSLLIFYFRRWGALSWPMTGVTVFLPLTGIVFGLAMLNMARGVISVMGGLRDPSADDAAHALVTSLTVGSTVLVVPLVLVYVALVGHRLYQDRTHVVRDRQA